MGAATALHSAMCFVSGNYANGNLYQVNLSAIVGLSGWLSCSRFDFYDIYVHGQMCNKPTHRLVNMTIISSLLSGLSKQKTSSLLSRDIFSVSANVFL